MPSFVNRARIWNTLRTRTFPGKERLSLNTQRNHRTNQSKLLPNRRKRCNLSHRASGSFQRWRSVRWPPTHSRVVCPGCIRTGSYPLAQRPDRSQNRCSLNRGAALRSGGGKDPANVRPDDWRVAPCCLSTVSKRRDKAFFFCRK